jgi:hypothetical protein
MQAKAFDAVLDFDCDHRYSRAVFHVVVDCFNAQLSMVAMVLYRNQNTNSSSKVYKAIKNVAIVFPREMHRYMELVCLTFRTHGIMPTFFSSKGPGSDLSVKCVAQHFSLQSIAFTVGYQSWFVVRSNHPNSACLTGGRLYAAIVRHIYHQENSKCSKIVVLSRNDTRRFIDQGDLLAALYSNFGRGNILVHEGNENFSQTVSMFKQACAVVGYHGAAAINMFYTPPATLCLEIVIFDTTKADNSSNWRPWRSNKVRISEAAGSKWQLKLIEPHHFWISKSNAASPDVKHGNVLLTREHIADIVWRLESHLERIDHDLTQQKSNPVPDTSPFRIPDVKLGFR